MRFPEGWRGNLALAAASTLAVLLVFVLGYEVRGNIRYYRWRARFDSEGWAGRLTVASENPTLLWEYRPYGSVPGISVNRYGFRDVDYPTPRKPEGVRRIAFLGDSVTVGMGVGPDETFVSRLGLAATTPGRPVQALNFGVDGYNGLQIRELLTAKVLAFEPDQVVYVMCLNDFDFTDSSGRKISYFRKPRSFLLLDADRAYRALTGAEFHHYHFRRHSEEVFAAIRGMKRVLDGLHARFLVAVVPVFPEGLEKGRADYFTAYPFADIHEAIVGRCRADGVPVQDLLEAFRVEPAPPDRYALDVWHLTAEGHRVVAASLLPAVREP
jgi:lysophospholipase L1-like esterase